MFILFEIFCSYLELELEESLLRRSRDRDLGISYLKLLQLYSFRNM